MSKAKSLKAAAVQPNGFSTERIIALADAAIALPKCKNAQDVFAWFREHKNACGLRNLARLCVDAPLKA